MEVSHILGDLKVKRDSEKNLGFLLGNKKGGYCSFYNQNSSRYHGMFYFDAQRMAMFKFIEDIEIEGINKVDALRNYFYFTERKKGDFTENFFMPSGYNSLVYELDQDAKISLLLDCREPFDQRQWGRYYKIFRQDKCIVVQFTKKTDSREDQSNDVEEFTIYLAVRLNSDLMEEADKWMERYYPFDEERGTNPARRYVYIPFSMHGSKFVFSISKDMEKAVLECNYIFSRSDSLKKIEGEYLSKMLHGFGFEDLMKGENASDEIKIAYACAINSLNNLVVNDENDFGVLAGYPWFFQFWSRDTMVCLKSIFKLDGELASKILLKYLNSINEDGRILNLFGKDLSNSLESADAHGWMFLRAHELVSHINENKKLLSAVNRISKRLESKNNDLKSYTNHVKFYVDRKYNHLHHALYEIEISLQKSLNGLLKHHTREFLETNNPKETWIDTNFGNDNRDGTRIEIQAMRLNMYKLMFEITRDEKYAALLNIMQLKVTERFWNSKVLADGENDYTIRPNIFLAHYAFSELLSKDEWSECFTNALERLWLNWGGLSTIDTCNSLFVDHDFGEDTRAYHRGDSWFWVNNLSCISLHRVDHEKFRRSINMILNSSTDDILWNGCIGCHSEISDAKELSSRGCSNQGWSNAMYIEMIEELFGV